MSVRKYLLSSCFRVLAAATLFAGLAGCVAVRVPALPHGDLPAHWRNVDNSPNLGPPPDLTGWWQRFNDPQLDALVTQALHDNLNVQQAVLKLRAARALETTATTRFLPSLAFNTLEQPNAENTASYIQAGFDATWEFGLFGRRDAAGHMAQAQTGAAAADLADARVSLVAEVVREYLLLRATQRSEVLLADAAKAAQEKVSLLRVQERLQLASQLDVEQGVAAAAKAAAAAADPRAASVQHAQALALLLGKSEPAPAWLAPAPLPKLAAGNFDSVPANLLRTRPEIRYAETQVLQAAGELGIAKSDLYPHLALGSSLTLAARVVSNKHIGEINPAFAVGPVINIPLFNWGRLRKVRDARNDQLQAALLAYRQAVLKGAAEVETDLAALNASRQRLHGADVAARASQSGFELTEKLQGFGQADGLQRADARLTLTGFELDREQARLAHGLAFVALYKALGGAPLPNADGRNSPAVAPQPPAALPAPAGPDKGSHSRDSAPSPLPLSRRERGSSVEPAP